MRKILIGMAVLAVSVATIASAGGPHRDPPAVMPRIIVPEVQESVEEEMGVQYSPAWSERQFQLPDVDEADALDPVDAQDLEYLACVIYQEAGSDWMSDFTRMAVGNVVLNRVADPRFPDTIEEVLLQQGQYGEYSWTGIQWLDSAEYEPWAVERAYECARRLLEGERVFPENVVWQAGFTQGDGVEVYSDLIYFCY